MKYTKVVVWVFAWKKWADVIAVASSEVGPELGGFIGVDRSTIANWSKGRFTDEFKFPAMHNFIRACDLLDLDPTEFFIQEDVE